MTLRCITLLLMLATILPALEDSFREPPRQYAPSAFWWWFLGYPYRTSDVESSIEEMRQAGLGGFRITPVYSFPGAEGGGPRYLSDGYLELAGHAVRHGRSLGMIPESLLGSGWPYGGPYIPPEMGAMRIWHTAKMVDGPGALPDVEILRRTAGETLIALQLAKPDHEGGIDPTSVIDLAVTANESSATLETVPPGRWVLLAFFSGPTAMKVKRAAPGGEGLVLDHFRREAIELHLRRNGDVQASVLQGLRAISMDSWEVFGANWTPALPEEFERRRGYRLQPYLAALFVPSGDVGERVRYDFRRTISELALENFFSPLRDWAHKNGLQTRVEAHGTPADVIEAYGLQDTPEAEAYGSQDTYCIRIRDRRLASSAAHLFDRTVVSSETFTWLRYPMFQATLAQMKNAADSSYLDGINHVNFHGVPFTPRSAPGPGFYFYASTFVSPGNTWWPYLPHLSAYLRRCNFMLQQGSPVIDVAVYLPLEDIWSEAFGSWYDLAGSIEQRFEGNGTMGLLRSLGASGYSFDLINGARLAQDSALRYRAIILPDVERMDPVHLRALLKYQASGGVVLSIGQVPSKSPGVMDSHMRDAEVASITAALFGINSQNVVPRHHAQILQPLSHPAISRLRATVPADLTSERLGTHFAFVHRSSAKEEIFFIANLQEMPAKFSGSFRVSGKSPRIFRPDSGVVEPIYDYADDGRRTEVTVSLGPRESVFVVFGSSAGVRVHAHNVDRILSLASGVATSEVSANGEYFVHTGDVRLSAEVQDIPAPLALGRPWRLSAPGLEPRLLDAPELWTKFPEYASFSGTGIYLSEFTLPDSWLRADQRVLLDCGEVREIAEVLVNGRSAGVAWRPPYVFDITDSLGAKNILEVRVTNVLFNRMLHADPLPAPYVSLGVGDSTPVPSGLRGILRLRAIRTIRLTP